MNLLDCAIYIATEAHRGDLNKHDGELYIHHPQRIAINLRDSGYSEKYQAVAWMHDVVEDTEWSLQLIHDYLTENYWDPDGRMMSEIHVMNEVIAALDAMTHRKGETNEDYYKRIARKPDC
jgi:hypothetical protein